MLILMTFVTRIISFYEILIIAHCIMTWLPLSGFFGDVKEAVAKLCEPFLGIFRKFIPPFGMMDFSPFVAVLALDLLQRLLVMLVWR